MRELEKRHRGFRILCDRPDDAAALLAQQFSIVAGVRDGASVLVTLNGHAPETVNAALIKAGLAVAAFAPEERWLDRLFLSLTTSKEPPREDRVLPQPAGTRDTAEART
jgi:hypothetical protein